ncbi:putative efflux protein, MATE family [Pelagirhabdus alkalitolerans]|uniref:Putative efflux protein, MATE family n=1 Tax=Pelagirhabdus alkalitolerans TaxID=1612202 RepID=A0A1G6IM64_9BACI|nr:MATE family efflux transporter [Pelagirhabdus alkalitolerans]SDC07577.1 putative efflux protein, MATE family [Pelagirhabdus alkalitolerans]
MEIRGDFKTFSKYVSLNVIGMIGLAVYILADTIFIANGIGEIGLAALNLAIPIFTLISGIGLLIGIGGATWYTILRAQEKEQSATSVFNHALTLASLLSLVFVVLGAIFSEELARLSGANDETLILTQTYLQVILLFSPFFIFNNMLVAFVRNDKNPKLAMTGMFVGSLFNIVMDYILIFTFEMGMLGAAIATGSTPIVSLMILSFHFKTPLNTFRIQKIQWHLHVFLKTIALGISAFITEISSGIVILIFNFVILRISGNIGVAAYGIIANISFVVIAIYTGMAQGIQPIVSHLFGLGHYRDMRRILQYGVIVSLLLAFTIYLFVTLGSDPLIDLFNRNQNPDLHGMAEEGLMIYFIGFFFAGFNMISIAYLSAIERAGIAFKLSIVRSFVLIVPIIIVLAQWLMMTGVWLSFVLTEAIMMGIIIWQIAREKKKDKRLRNA